MKEMVKSLVVALFIAVIIRSFFIEPYSIPSGSMKPNFVEGDYIFVSKFAYGISRYSLPFWPKVFEGRKFVLDTPKRGDVVVFRGPTNPNIHYIKRLIGFPGDKIQIKSGRLYLNGVVVDYKNAPTYKDKNGDFINMYKETLPDQVSYNVLDITPYGTVDNTMEYVVPEKHYFVMGDNRDASLDSRFLEGPVGYVQEDYIIGRVDLVLFSNPTPIWQIWKWIFTFNKERFFKVISQ